MEFGTGSGPAGGCAPPAGPRGLIALDLGAVLADFDANATLAFFVIHIANHSDASDQYGDHQVKNVAIHDIRPFTGSGEGA